MLTTELGNVEERFAEVVADLDWLIEGKIRPLSDGDDDSTREEDLVPWDDDDMPDDDLEWP